jgi:hypothetical protein
MTLGSVDPLPQEFARYQFDPTKASVLPVVQAPLTVRVEKLEAQVDSILDRLAKFSIRASHKI